MFQTAFSRFRKKIIAACLHKTLLKEFHHISATECALVTLVGGDIETQEVHRHVEEILDIEPFVDYVSSLRRFSRAADAAHRPRSGGRAKNTIRPHIGGISAGEHRAV